MEARGSRVVGDTHSHLVYNPEKVYILQTSQLQELLQKPVGKYLEKNIGYIKIPQFQSANDTVIRIFADLGQEIIRGLDQNHKINRWIVDLREAG